MRAPALRPGFGPPLRLSGRGGVVAVAGLAAVAALALASREDREQAIVHGQPTYNVLYDGDELERVDPQAGESLRLEGRRRGVRASLAVRPVELEPYRGDVSSGVLPVLAERRLGELRAALPGFRLLDEGRDRVGEAAGYQVGFRADGDLRGSEVFVVEGPRARRGHLLSLRVRGDRRRSPRLVNQALRAFRSFNFGTGRP